MCRQWTEEDVAFLESRWGYSTIDCISKNLNRSRAAIKNKVGRLKLKGATTAGDYVTATVVSKITEISWKTIVDTWIKKYGLKAVKQNRTGERLIWYIKMQDLIDWLKNNQDKWDSKRVEMYALGEEPEWLKEKRRKDREENKKYYYRYTSEEVRKMENMFYGGFTYKQIADEMGRTEKAIRRKFDEIRKNKRIR